MAFIPPDKQTKLETPEQRATRLKNSGEEIPQRVVKEWTYSESKDLSMNIGGILHDASTLLAPKNLQQEDLASATLKLTEELYLGKEELINKIKKS